MLDFRKCQEVGEFLKRVGQSKGGADRVQVLCVGGEGLTSLKGTGFLPWGCGCVGGLVYPERTRPETHTRTHTSVDTRG